MSDSPDGPSSGPRQHLVEVGVAAFMALLGIIAIVGSLKVGTGWGAEGPKSGFFPFWIGAIVVGTSLYNMVRAWTHAAMRLKCPFRCAATYGDQPKIKPASTAAPR